MQISMTTGYCIERIEGMQNRYGDHCMTAPVPLYRWGNIPVYQNYSTAKTI